MRTSRYSDSQILAILKQNENSVSVPELYREHGMSSAMFYKWRAKFGGMDASMMKRLKELEAENAHHEAHGQATTASIKPLADYLGSVLVV